MPKVRDLGHRPRKCRPTIASMTVMTNTAHGTLGVHRRFDRIKADQIPCGTKVIASAIPPVINNVR